MKKSIAMVRAGLESSSGETAEFRKFFTTFKKEFTKELESCGAHDIQFSKGHFYISGFYTIGTKPWYFSTLDLRDTQLRLYFRKVDNYKDYTGGQNQWREVKEGMGATMHPEAYDIHSYATKSK